MKTIRETSDFVANKLIEMSGLSDNMILLEPSCGNGKIIKTILENYTFSMLTILGYELNKQLVEQANEMIYQKELYKNTNTQIEQADFLNKDFYDFKFNRVIAAPPFKNNSDVLHIQKMYEVLAKKGILVSLTTPYWLTNNEPHQVAFRKFLQGKEYYITMLPDNTFMEKDKTVPTAIIKLFKK
jgi:cyclopropane fatty-acyl-phospholipid synthase-like methyltransferase